MHNTAQSVVYTQRYAETPYTQQHCTKCESYLALRRVHLIRSTAQTVIHTKHCAECDSCTALHRMSPIQPPQYCCVESAPYTAHLVELVVCPTYSNSGSTGIQRECFTRIIITCSFRGGWVVFEKAQ